MKILVFSDTHGDTALLRKVISQNREGTDLVVHLGDHLKDLQDVMLDFPLIASLGVIGNCDFPSMYSSCCYEATFSCEGRKIFYTHGHKFNVKYGFEYIVHNAKFNKADVVLYGHSHIALIEEHNGVTVINPGSLSCPRDGSNGTYAVLKLSDGKLECEIKEVDYDL